MFKQISILVLCIVLSIHTRSNSVVLSKPTTANNLLTTLTSSLDINSDALKLALDGYEKLKEQGKLNNVHYLTIIDFSKPSTSNRFYVIDMEQGQLLLQTLVAHGKKSGTVFANTFSNKDASSKSSLGFYVTGKTYIGKHGTTLELEGQEKGINDNAKERAIVIHGANYVSESIAKQQGYIGRSLGCPAVPNDQVNTIIEAIQGASCLFVYAPVKSYMRQSTLAN